MQLIAHAKRQTQKYRNAKIISAKKIYHSFPFLQEINPIQVIDFPQAA